MGCLVHRDAFYECEGFRLVEICRIDHYAKVLLRFLLCGHCGEVSTGGEADHANTGGINIQFGGMGSCPFECAVGIVKRPRTIVGCAVFENTC